VVESLISDLRQNVRSLRARPGFTALAVLMLALGIGACTAIFSVVDAVLLRPLPYPGADRIMQISEVNAKGVPIRFADPNFQDLHDRSRSFDAVAQYTGELTTITGGSEPIRAPAFVVSKDFFRVIGVEPVLGRGFLPDETRTGGTPVALVSYGLWQRVLGGNQDLAATRLRLMDQNVTVVGVMPPDLAFPRRAEIWIPRELFPPEISRTAHNWSVIGRLRTGATIESALAEVSAISKQLKQEHGKDMDAVDFNVIALQESIVGRVRRPLLMILVAVGFLLAVACANVANLLLAQITARQREFAVRCALGATRVRLARLFITENLLLTFTGAALGIVLAYWGVDLLLGLNQQSLPRINEIGIDARAIGFTIGLAFMIAIVLGVVPLLRFSGADLEPRLRENSLGARGYAGHRLRSWLVVSQMALTLVLLIGAGLLAKSFYRLLHVDPGFRTEKAVAMEISFPSARNDEQRYKEFMRSYTRLLKEGVPPDTNIQLSSDEQRLSQFQRQLLERMNAMPGVIAAGSVNSLPLTGGGADGNFLIANDVSRKGHAEYRLASSGYFAALEIPVLRGRVFDRTDGPDAPHAAVISQSFARKYWPNEDPIGQTIQFGNMDSDLRLLHIVGVVGDVHDYGVDAPVVPTVYGNALQRLPSRNLTVVARGQVASASLAPAMREVVRSLDPQLPVRFRTLDEVYSSSLDQQRFSLVIFGVFGVIALLLAGLGIYGVTSYMVAQRTQEIGIRMALGAQVRDVLRLVLKNGLGLSLLGAVIGLAGALAITRVMSSLLFGVAPTDFSIFSIVTLLLIGVALAACLVPALRATKVDPLVALRYE
jgi:putative ABC transport system permease protein